MGALNWPIFLLKLYSAGVTLTPDHRLASLEPASPSCGRLRVSLVNEYSHAHAERTVDAVVVEHGTLPADELYLALRPRSRNDGEIDLEALSRRRACSGSSATRRRPCAGGFDLFRVGDAEQPQRPRGALRLAPAVQGHLRTVVTAS